MELKQEFQLEIEQFVQEINSPDLLNVILRGHLYIEAKIIELLENRFTHPEEFKMSDINYPNKINLCVALGIIDRSETKAYLKLNKLRNTMAHQLQPSQIEKEIGDIISSLSNEQRKLYKTNKIEDGLLYNLRKALAVLFVDLNAILESIKNEEELFQEIIPLFKDYKKE
ncbi:hypothetical protein [Peribacillus frigoritolerans]|uniref:hypothetical protein n=1 Tax=Peribacillus frigoritolerans TaxID=450367 RepID=UPI0023DB6F3F|nr:hypothetical protein [Peribacillus frigoritolerans]MDF1997582.1 hypothetical protein [Peribacillus frigoritolerans]